MATGAKSGNLIKAKPSFGDRPKCDSSASKKKVVEGSSNNSAADLKNRSPSIASKMSVAEIRVPICEEKTKKTASQSKDATKKSREKKVFSLPGQKFDVPEEREPLRIFYESLSEQIPSSEMAEFWLMEHGMLSPERAKRALEKKQRKQKQLRLATPVKSPLRSTSTKPETSKRPQPVPKNIDAKAKKRIINGSDDDDDFVLSHKRRKG